MRRGFTKTELVVVGLILAAVVLPCVGIWAPVHLILLMLFGWIGFLIRVTPRIEPDGNAIALSGIALVVFVCGLHGLLMSFYRPAGQSDASPTQTWRWRWTISSVAIIVMLFVAGISMVGITHQIAWLATAKEPLFSPQLLGSRRMESSNNLKQLVISLHNYHDEHQAFPAGMQTGSQGEALHGWLTILLPYLEQKALYDTIDLNQPWNGPENKPALATMLRTLLIRPRAAQEPLDAEGYALSHYAANLHVLGGTSRVDFSKITDGASNTILAGEAAGNYKPWGHPRNWRDPAIGINTSPDGFGGPWTGGGAQFALADGSVRFIRSDIDPAVLRALATPAGGEQVPDSY